MRVSLRASLVRPLTVIGPDARETRICRPFALALRVLDAPPMSNHPTTGFAIALALAGCGSPATTDDASVTDAPLTTDAPTAEDAALARGPTDVHWESVALDDAMPDVWGWSAAGLPDGRTALLGGAIGASAGAALSRVLVLAPSADGTLVTEPLARPELAPSPRWCTCATFDAARDRVLFAGGRNASALGGIAGATWELDVSSGAFRELTETPTPPGVIGCALAYSAERRATYWFGGASESVVSGSIHRLDADGSAWVELPATGPTPRYDPHFEALDGRWLLLFGGSYGARGAAFYSDVWVFDTQTETWSEIEVDGATPPGRRAPWVRFSESRTGFYAGFGYDGSMRPLGDLHYFDLDAAVWSEIAVPEPIPAARGVSPAVEGPAGSIGLLLPGLGGGATVRDAFVLRTNE